MKLAMVTNVSSPSEDDTPQPADSWGGETDWGLIRNASNGAPAFNRDRVWGELIHRYEGPVRRVLGRHLRGDPAVEDAVADFFSELFQKRQILERADPGQGRFRCYIQGVIRRYALQWKRSHGMKLVQDVDAIEVAAESKDEVEGEEELLWADAILEHAIGRLQREAKRDAEILLAYYGLFGHAPVSAEELARQRSLSVATFHVALHRARSKLRAALVEELRPMVSSSEDMATEQQFLITRLCAAHPGLDLGV